MNAYIALGSNLDNPQQHIKQALLDINQLKDCCILKYSSLYQSTALGINPQPDYFNAVIKLKTLYSPKELLKHFQQIEISHGRIRKERWASRTLDLDILLYENFIFHEEDLIIPHPEMPNRDFVLIPLKEIEPNLILPNGKKLDDLIKKCEHNNLKKINSIFVNLSKDI